jgi:DNA-binding transcriptional ArsR family regulator
MNAARRQRTVPLPARSRPAFGSPGSGVEVIAHAARAAALLDPTRLALLERLAEPDSASGLARKLGLPRQRINYHLRALERAGLVEEVETRRRGNCTERLVRSTAASYVIDPSVLGRMGADPDRIEDRFSSAHLVALAARAIREVSAQRARADREGKRIATLSLQVDVRFATAESRGAFAAELARTVAALAARYHDAESPAGRTFRFVVGGYPAPPLETEPPGAPTAAPPARSAAPDATGFPDPEE